MKLGTGDYVLIATCISIIVAYYFGYSIDLYIQQGIWHE